VIVAVGFRVVHRAIVEPNACDAAFSSPCGALVHRDRTPCRLCGLRDATDRVPTNKTDQTVLS
jgi:hypothetical protein